MSRYIYVYRVMDNKGVSNYSTTSRTKAHQMCEKLSTDIDDMKFWVTVEQVLNED